MGNEVSDHTVLLCRLIWALLSVYALHNFTWFGSFLLRGVSRGVYYMCLIRLLHKRSYKLRSHNIYVQGEIYYVQGEIMKKCLSPKITCRAFSMCLLLPISCVVCFLSLIFVPTHILVLDTDICPHPYPCGTLVLLIACSNLL